MHKVNWKKFENDLIAHEEKRLQWVQKNDSLLQRVRFIDLQTEPLSEKEIWGPERDPSTVVEFSHMHMEGCMNRKEDWTNLSATTRYTCRRIATFCSDNCPPQMNWDMMT